MVRLAVTISVFALLACGGSDTGQTADAGGAPPVEAAAGEQPDVPAVPMPAATVAPEVQSCLDLIRQAQFEKALPVCLAALDVDPDNQQVRDAVAQARTETAKLAAAKAAGEAADAAADAAAEDVAEEASSQIEEAAGGLTGEMTE